MMHGWQSESTDRPKRGWICAFGVAAVATSPTTAECSVVWCVLFVVVVLVVVVVQL